MELSSHKLKNLKTYILGGTFLYFRKRDFLAARLKNLLYFRKLNFLASVFFCSMVFNVISGLAINTIEQNDKAFTLIDLLL